MEYFVMKQDPQAHQTIKLLNLANPIDDKHSFSHLRMSKQETHVMLVAEDVYNEYPDFIEQPIHLIGGKLKRVMGLYQPQLYFETVVMVEPQRGKQTVYHLMVTPEMDCASDQTVRYFGKIKELVLDVQKVGNQRIFKVQGDSRLIVRLDVVESILRRIPYGIVFEPVKLEMKEGVNNG